MEQAKSYEELQAEVAQLKTELHRTQVMFRTLIDTIPGYIFVKDRNFQYLWSNSTIATMLGTTPEAMVGKDDSGVGFPDELIWGNSEKGIRGFRADDRAVIETGEHIHNPYDPAVSGGEVHVFDTHKIPLHDTDGSIFGVLGIARNITQQYRAEEGMRQLHAELEQRVEERTAEVRMQAQILDQVPGSVVVTSMDGTITSWNKAAMHIYGYTPEEVIGQSITLIYPPDQHDTLLQKVKPTLQTQGALEIEAQVCDKAGRRFPIFLSLSLLYDEHNNPIGMIGYSVDISERKQTERTARVNQLAIDRLADSVFWIKPDASFFYVNEAVCRNLGYTAEELLTMSVADVDPDFPMDRWTGLWEHIKAHRMATFETHHQRKDGSIYPVEIMANFMFFDDEEFMYAFARDITERKRSEKELQRYVDIIEKTTDSIGSADIEGNIIMVNQAFRDLIGLGADADVSQHKISHFHPESSDQRIVEEGIPTAIRDGVWSGENILLNRTTGQETPVSQVIIAHKRHDGSVNFLSTIMRDLTGLKAAETERTELQEQIIEAQQAALRELSAPLLPISDSVVVMPLIGSIDTRRAQQIMEMLLEGVAQNRADTAIVDITGVQVVDTQVANALIQAAQAVKLLGAQVVLTGIGPTMAQTLVSLGADLSSIVTRGSLQSGIAYAMQV